MLFRHYHHIYHADWRATDKIIINQHQFSIKTTELQTATYRKFLCNYVLLYKDLFTFKTTFCLSPVKECGGDYRNAICPSVSLSVCMSVTFRGRAITNVCIDGLSSNLVQMLSLLRRCAVTLTRIHTSNIKVIQHI